MSKYSPETKIAACKDYLSGKYTHKEVCQKYGITFNETVVKSMLNEWVPRYLHFGKAAFLKTKGNKDYSAEYKMNAVKEYLDGKGSLIEIAAKYNIPSKATLSNWVKDYTKNKELKAYHPHGTLYTNESKRFVSAMERREITQYCFDHNLDYKGTAARFNISYAQIYGWCKRSPLMKSYAQK